MSSCRAFRATRPPKPTISVFAPPDGETVRRLDAAVGAVDAPDVVFTLSRHGHRTLRCGGTAPAPPVPRHRLRYELGPASKTPPDCCWPT